MTYAHLAQRTTALACFLGPALLVLGSILYVAYPGSGGLFAGSELYNDPVNKLEWAFCCYFGNLLILPAYVALTAMVGQLMPRRAMTTAALGLPGLASQLSGHNYEVSLATAGRSGMDVSWSLLIPNGPSAAQLIMGLPIVLYFLSMVILGIGVLRSGALPRWCGVPLIAAGVLQFDSTGPQPSGLPLLTWLLAALCLALVYAQVGRQLWRGEVEPALAGQAIGAV